MSAKHK
jgi:hypothetical protein